MNTLFNKEEINKRPPCPFVGKKKLTKTVVFFNDWYYDRCIDVDDAEWVESNDARVFWRGNIT